MVDVSQHDLVPEHRVVSDSELDDVLDEYNIDRTDLPKIKRTDAAVPDQAEVGDVLEIVRDSRTTDQAVVYRLVIQ
ncbi:DNA-directed RNA polymerase subunit H [Halosegnis rubeus]|jgi:DNA-directed RNA polymerase subunit H|uniref:DNA-directed RNA polymerase subunit Rpo5 n=2 Tax=Halosegnis TaxID=2841540 RepID=A0A5N5UDK6_9EURY|nr:MULTISPECIES: DNA-directed RNA polymerase subunit H [Halobacteriales]KAB7515275.1 DNA-directed RNA polymerase subunit H [Halosegnis rubeus]KAB7516329.1 DNA-directed RNA polymerase subunit H [Halosegnis rubeus]KAB7517683.1 DNA-directed RNA polymerase subunit H [Halosegnis rubeus]RNJ25289.1 DNA-directed RNA polymerase subunit H [Salella cibi]